MVVRALIIEDEKNPASLLRGYLEREGFEVHEAFDGEAGLEAAWRVWPDVVVLDWMLPKLDGMGGLRELRRFSEAYVVMLTARAEEVDKIVSLSAGADDYLTKPSAQGSSSHQRLEQIKYAVLERSGGISIIPRQES